MYIHAHLVADDKWQVKAGMFGASIRWLDVVRMVHVEEYNTVINSVHYRWN